MRVEHQTGGSNNWRTPPDFLEGLGVDFALDCAADAPNVAPHYLTDAFNQTWVSTGPRWLNPPYSRQCILCGDWCGIKGHPSRTIKDWMRKASREGMTGTDLYCLINARTDTAWWHEYVHGAAAQVFLVRGRLKFWTPTGPADNGAAFPSALVVYRGGSGRTEYGGISVMGKIL